MTPTSIVEPLARRVRRLAAAGVERGVPPSWFGYRWIRRESVPDLVARRRAAGDHLPFEIVHPASVADNPLPRNVDDRDELPADRGWWGYSFHDVPERRSSETFIATIPDVRVVTYRDPERGDDFFPAAVTGDGRALELREIVYRPKHAPRMRSDRAPVRLDRATWILERVYHNHSHWLTAHLPKLVLLRDRDELGEVLLPARRTPAIDGSLRLLGLDPDRFRTHDPTRPLEVGQLTILGTDRFRPELLQGVQRASADPLGDAPRRRVFISRAKAARRRLLNEDAVWPRLDAAGFERVVMEELSFEDQVELMRETAVLVAPHGAGLTNMVFCAPGTHVVEIADLGFPNPNFYAMAAALGHPYWIVDATSRGDGRALDKDLEVEVGALDAVLERLLDT